MGYKNTKINRKAVCPFYIGDKECKIVCEGVIDNTTIHLNFGSREELKEYADRYCCLLDNYKNCRLCDMLDLKHYKDG